MSTMKLPTRGPYPVLPRLALLAGMAALSACAARTTLSPGQTFPVFFTTASTNLDPRGQDVVGAAVAWARRYPEETVTVTGYADPRAPAAEITRLATRRADAVAGLLEEKGVAPTRIRRAIGDEALIGLSGLANRRVDIAVGP